MIIPVTFIFIWKQGKEFPSVFRYCVIKETSENRSLIEKFPITYVQPTYTNNVRSCVPCDSAGKECACNVGDPGSIPGSGRSPGEQKGYPLQYSGLENSTDCVVLGVAKSQTRLSNFHLHLTCLWQVCGNKWYSVHTSYQKAHNVFCPSSWCCVEHIRRSSQ